MKADNRCLGVLQLESCLDLLVSVIIVRLMAEAIENVKLDQVLGLQKQGAQILDTRDPNEFAAAHLAGTINIALAGQYATWAGTLLDRTHPIVLAVDSGLGGDVIRPAHGPVDAGGLGDHAEGRALLDHGDLALVALKRELPAHPGCRPQFPVPVGAEEEEWHC